MASRQYLLRCRACRFDSRFDLSPCCLIVIALVFFNFFSSIEQQKKNEANNLYINFLAFDDPLFAVAELLASVKGRGFNSH